MKRLIVICLFLAGCLCMNGFIITPAESVAPEAQTVDTVQQPDATQVQNARIENLLNKNNVYGENFLNNEKLVNLAAIALRSFADENGFIEQGIVISYIKDMYDIDLVITDDINEAMPKKEGYVYLIPRGYTTYAHEIISVTDNGDYITVESDVVVSYHDGGSDNGIATTVLIKNENSSFGYSILDSNIVYNPNAISII